MKCTFLTLLGCITLATPPVANAQQAGDFLYSSDGSVITITGYTGAGGDITIPDAIEGLPVTAIGESAFYWQNSLNNVTVPGSVTRIGSSAFSRCGYLSCVTLSAGVSDIGNSAFYFCSDLSNVTIPSSVTNIGTAAFAFCSSLSSIKIPASITRIEDNTFLWCHGLTSVTIPGSVRIIGNYAFQLCDRLTSVTLSDGVTSIGGFAFQACRSLPSVTIPGNVTNMGAGAFTMCDSLTGVFFKGNSPSSGEGVFNSSPATVYYLPGSANWSDTYGEKPAILWNPVAQTGDRSFGVGTNGFGFNITGTPDIPVVVEASTDPAGATWETLQSLTLTDGLGYFSDPGWTNHPARFYRLRSP